MAPIDDDSRKWWILAAMGGVLGLLLLDETVVGVALPSIKGELGLSQVASHWVVNAYLLVFAGLAAAAGKFGDIIGLRNLFVVGVAIFALASIASGLAQDGISIIAARAVQGIGAAAIFPASLAMITNAFPREQRGMALGIYGSIGGVFLSLGPLIGGIFTETLSWRWIFGINPPIVIVIICVILAAWREPQRNNAAKRVDLLGLVTLVAGLGMLVFAVMQGPAWGWSHLAVWSLLVAGAVVLALFAKIESRTRLPLIDVELFRNPSFTACALVIFMAQFSKILIFVFGALYLQNVLKMNAFTAGLALLAAVVPTPILAAPAGKLADRVGERPLVLCGLAATAAAILWLALAVTWNDYVLLMPAFVVWGAAQPFLFMPAQRAVMNAVPADKQGEVGGIAMTARLLGGTLGMTICGTLLAATGNYWLVFLVTGCSVLTILVLGRFAIDGQRHAS